MRQKRKCTFFLFLTFAVIMLSTAFTPRVPVYARDLEGFEENTNNEPLLEEEENKEHPEEEMGTVHIQFLVDSLYMYKDSIQVRFEEVNTGEFYTISAGDFRQETVTVEMPEGEWRYYFVRFEEKAVYGVYGYLSGMDTFVVKAGEETSIGITVEDHQTATQAMSVDLNIENDHDFDGTVQMWIEGETDAYYTDPEGLTSNGYVGDRIKEAYTLRFDSDVGYTTIIDAGTYQVVKVYAYDSEGNALDICYTPEITISRYNSNPQIDIEIYPPGSVDSVNGKYQVFLAANTPEFTYNYYYRDVVSLRENLGIQEDSLFEGLDDEAFAEQAAEEEAEYQETLESIEAEDTDPEEIVERDEGNALEIGLIVLVCFSLFVPFIFGIRYCYRCYKKDQEKKTH